MSWMLGNWIALLIGAALGLLVGCMCAASGKADLARALTDEADAAAEWRRRALAAEKRLADVNRNPLRALA